MVRIFNDQQEKVISFSREKNGRKVIIVINLGKSHITVTLQTKYHAGSYRELFSGSNYDMKVEDTMSLPAWGYKVLVR
jgi:hypothetical protein